MSAETFNVWLADRGLEPESAARALGVSLTTLKMWRNGGTPIRRVHVLAMRGHDCERGRHQLEMPIEISPAIPMAHRLTSEQEDTIRARKAQGESLRTLARDYGVSPSTIHSVVHRTGVA